MYEIYKDGRVISYEDKARYVKLQSNGTYCLCDEPEAHGVVVNNEYICHLEGKPPIPVAETVSIVEINGSALLTELDAAIIDLEYENIQLELGPEA
jgi:hypothetical protein